MQNIENSCKILLLISFKMSLNYPEMAQINDIINDKISFQAILMT